MNLSTAMDLFRSFEKEKLVELEGDPPLYLVRLDAGSDRDEERFFRLFVRLVFPQGGNRDAWQYVLEQAQEAGVEVSVENGGMELA